MRRPKVVPLDRTRRKKHWTLKDPPRSTRRWGLGRATSPRKTRRWGRMLLWLCLAGLLMFGTVGDAAMGVSKGATQCKVVSVIDGDTVTVWCGGTDFQRTRLTGFDTPEIFSPQCASERWLGLRATAALKGNLWSAGRIGIEPSGHDRYGRLLARMTVDGRSVGNDLIARDLARPYSGGRRPGWC